MRNLIELNAEAVALRRRFGFDNYSPIDVIALIEGIDDMTLVFYPFSERISGMSIKGDDYCLIAINSSSSYGRQRYTAAHELYHLYIRSEADIAICEFDGGKKTEIEREADQFASYFLAPYEALKEFVDLRLQGTKRKLGIEDVVRVEQHFKMSRAATLIRLRELGLLTKAKMEDMQQAVIASATRMGYDRSLYMPLPDKKYYTTGEYIKLVDELARKDKFSDAKREGLLLDAFRPDIVYDLGVTEDIKYE